jgi:hypothetical protein
MSTSRHTSLLTSVAVVTLWSLPTLTTFGNQDKEKPSDKGKGDAISAEKLAEEYVANLDKFAAKYQEKAIRVRGKLKIIDGQAFFVPGPKLSNGKPLQMLLAVSPADLKKYPEGSIVVADSPLMGVNEFRLVLNKCRLSAGTEKKPK